MDRAAPCFSVVMPVYNGCPYLQESLQSVLDQQFEDWELLVADDQSTDASRQVIEEFQRKDGRGRIRYIWVKEKKGKNPGRVRNLALAEARGAWVSFLDHDDLWTPDKLARHRAEAEAHPDAALIHNDDIFFDSRGPLNEGRIASRPELDPALLSGWCFPIQFNGNIFGMSCTSVKRSVLAELGTFDEQMIGTEDYDLFMRVTLHHPVRFIPAPLTRYRLHDGNLSKDGALMTENVIKCIRKICALYPERVAELRDVRPEHRLYGLYNYLGGKYLETGNPLKAAASYREAIRQIPASKGAWIRLLGAFSIVPLSPLLRASPLRRSLR